LVIGTITSVGLPVGAIRRPILLGGRLRRSGLCAAAANHSSLLLLLILRARYGNWLLAIGVRSRQRRSED
jgi:hypothetical protein